MSKLKVGLGICGGVIVLVILVIGGGIGIFVYKYYEDTGDVEIIVTDKYWYGYGTNRNMVLNITFVNSKNFPISFYSGDFKVISEKGNEYTQSVTFTTNPDGADEGEEVKLLIGFTLGTEESLDEITHLVYDTDQKWGSMKHVHKDIDI